MPVLIFALIIVAFILFLVDAIRTGDLKSWGLAALTLSFALARGILNG